MTFPYSFASAVDDRNYFDTLPDNNTQWTVDMAKSVLQNIIGSDAEATSNCVCTAGLGSTLAYQESNGNAAGSWTDEHGVDPRIDIIRELRRYNQKNKSLK